MLLAAAGGLCSWQLVVLIVATQPDRNRDLETVRYRNELRGLVRDLGGMPKRWTPTASRALFSEPVEGAVVLCSVSDDKYVSRPLSQASISSMALYASARGYACDIFLVDKFKCSAKVLLANVLLDPNSGYLSNPATQAIMFFDLDVVIERALRLDAVLARHAHCGLLVQDSARSVNTGWFMLRPWPPILRLSRNWLAAHAFRPPFPCDQVSLQEALLGEFANGTSCLARTRRKSEAPLPAHALNLCYERRMAKAGLGPGNRTRPPFCFLDHRTRVNMHDAGGTYRRGDALHHHSRRQNNYAPAVSREIRIRTVIVFKTFV